jgi:hypothetical protein
MKSFIALFSDQADIESVLNDLYQISDDEDEIEVRRVEGARDADASGESGRMAFPVPTTGGAVPAITLNDLDLSSEERRYLMDRAGSQGVIMQIRAKDEYMDQVSQIVHQHNGQAAKKKG